MKHASYYSPCQRFLATLLLFSLWLQSCGYANLDPTASMTSEEEGLAVEAGSLAGVETTNNIDSEKVDTQDEYGPLYEAVSTGQVAEFLLENDVDINVTDDYGRTLLHYAAAAGQVAAVELLLEKRADINVTDEYGCTPLHWAAREGQVAAVELLLEKGADREAQDEYGRIAFT